MKLALVVLVALGLTMVWQASVVAENNAQQQLVAPQVTVTPAAGQPQQG